MPRRAVTACLAAVVPAGALALQCPEMPRQASRDAEVEVRVGVRLLGDASGSELTARARQLTADLMGKLPRADRVYLEQMLFAAYCSAVRDNPALGEEQREARVLAYRREMQRTLAEAPTARRDPRDAARAELERLPMPYTPEAFYRAVRTGDLRAVRLFIAAGIDLEMRDRDDWRPLAAAVRASQWAVADALIDAGASPGGGVLIDLAALGDVPRLRRLLTRQPERAAIDTAFVSAAARGNVEAARLLESHGAELAALGTRALHAVAYTGDEPKATRALEWLLGRGVPVDTRNADGTTPLMTAVLAANAIVTRLLLQHGADPNLRCPCSGIFEGELTPLLIAATRGQQALVLPLLDAGADATAVSANRRNALHIVLEQGSSEAGLAALLLARGVPHDVPNARGETPLMWAAWRVPELVAPLLARGARPDARAHDGRTALTFAAMSNRSVSLRALLDAGAPLEARTETGRTALSLAVLNESVDAVRLLLAAGARADSADRNGLRPADHARALRDGEDRRAILRLLETAEGSSR